jgi:general secretion pathway protein G
MKSRGFTLVELLVVISIIGLLSSVVYSSLQSARQKAITARKQADMNQLLKAVQLYYFDKNSMPANVNPGCWCSVGTNYTAENVCYQPPGGVCLNELVTSGYYKSLPVSPDGNPYNYYNYGSFGMIAVRMVPEQYGLDGRGWHCSDATNVLGGVNIIV